MQVLVTYASRHGSTAGIAERISETLTERGLVVTLLPVGEARGVDGYDAFVIGSAVHMGRWMAEARTFVEHHQYPLASHPTWLFSSGPIGDKPVDAQGRDVLEAAKPREFADFNRLIGPRDHRVFFGSFDPEAKPVGLAERLAVPFMRMAAAKEGMLSGDFRDWPAIETWAEEIATALGAEATLVTAG
jgi:menaquinone-dependent protoporphyrinogen oxidase